MKAVIFDVDGTLVDTHAIITSAMEAAFAAAGQPVPHPDARKSVIGLSLEEAMRRLSGLEGPVVGELVHGYKTAYLASVSTGSAKEPLFEGARVALDTLRERSETLLGLATGKAMRGVERMMNAHGLNDYFVTRQTPDNNPSKPHPGMLLRAMDECGVDRRDMVMVGDTTFDIEMARAARVPSIGVAWGYHPHEDLTAAGADVIIHEYAELVPVLDDMLGAQVA